MKKITALLVLFFLSFTNIYAHSGRTDANWCHKDSSTWEIHCHSLWTESSSSSSYSTPSYSTSSSVSNNYSDSYILSKLKEWKRCWNLAQEEMNSCFNFVKNNTSVYTETEIKEEIKSNRSCNKFIDFPDDLTSCNSLYQDYLNEIQTTKSSVLKSNNTVKNVITEEVSKPVNKNSALYKKVGKLHSKNPKSVEKLWIQLSALLKKTSKSNKKYSLILELDSMIKDIQANSTQNTSDTYTVTSVTDWDTITIDYNGEKTKIRMIWIDTPESFETRFWYVECYGKEASDYLKSILEGKKVTIEKDTKSWEKDKYWRMLAYVFLDWVNINEKLISEWYAWEYTYNNIMYKYRDNFISAQSNADINDSGLWNENTCNWERKAIVSDDTDAVIESITWSTNSIINWFSCEVKKTYCKDMSSWDEAQFYLNQCSLTRLDSDGDGNACESLK